MNIFPLHATDGYKVGHKPMYQEGTQMIYSNFTPRSNRLFKGGRLYDDKMVVFGIQGFVKEFLIETFNSNFFNQPKEKVIKRYARRMDNYLGKGVVDVSHIAALHDLGYLPLEIKALPEGSRVRMGIPVMTVRNTVPEFYWLVNYLETAWSNSVWKSMTNATIAFEYRKVFDHFAELTGSPREFVQWQGHDFAYRGMSGIEDGARSNAGHLLSFTGTDTIAAIDYLEDYYNADSDKELIGGSVPASEHSVSSSNILFNERDCGDKLLAEQEFLIDYITQIVPVGIASYVTDTYDYWGVLTKILPAVKSIVMGREGKLVIRPDSGDPVKIICGDTDAVTEHERKGSIEVLWDIFGGTINEKGYKVLDSHIGLIYGDSITLERQWEILERLEAKGFASCNVVLGIGSYTYNYSTRDTFGSAVKATATQIDGEMIEIYKDPATASSKKSAKGFLRVEQVGREYVLKDQVDFSQNGGCLQTIFFDGILLKETSLAEIRDLLHN